ncbi:MAG: isoprenylcysteine carboxylmethyltransferase family protein [Chloroflexi bacterium]|nr:isoprenylcysteine carboxylmethyltransferase family protein [Chloroflexota bacterium]
MIVIKTLLFMLLMPGTFMFLIPLKLVELDTAFPVLSLGVLVYLGWLLILVGLSIMLSSAWDFAFKGRGTPAPIDPPTEFVAVGMYRYVRNPMYVGGIWIVLGWFLVYGASILLPYLAFVFSAFHLFVLKYEEPTLLLTFGETYSHYCAQVPRWLPRIKAVKDELL